MDIAAVWQRMHNRERATLDPLAYSAFRRAFAARTVSSAGSWMLTVAAGWLIFELTRSAVAVGVLTLLSRAPGVLAAYGGALVDRFEPRRLAAVLFAALFVPPAILAVIAWDNDASTTAIYVLVLLDGIIGSLAVPVLPTLIAGTVPKDMLGRANSLSAVGYSVASLAGPLIGGVLVTAVGAGACFAIDAVTYLIMGVVVVTLPKPAPAAEKAPRGLRPALRLSSNRGSPFFRILLTLVLFALLVGPVQELAPAIARTHGSGAHILGFLLSALAAGGLVGNLLIGRGDMDRHRRRQITGIEGLVFAATLVLLAVSGGLFLAMLAMFWTGVAWEAAFVQRLTWIQSDAPPSMKGRMLGLLFAAYLLALSLGALIIGAAFDHLGIQDSLLICAGCVFLYAAWSIWDARQPIAERSERAPGH